MANFAVVGTQWGDEGKGKVVDYLAPGFDFVIRYQGGHNAGHTVVFNGERHALHLLPSGVFHPRPVNYIANGVVAEPLSLMREIKNLSAKGIDLTPRNLKISDRAHLILPFHGIIDRHREASGPQKIGTTGRGIGPAYEWKVGRRGFRFCDLFHRDALKERLEGEMAFLRQRFPEVADFTDWHADDLMNTLAPAFDFLQPYVVDGVSLLAEARVQQKSMLFEGAQATLLDIDFGTYPYLTSSNTGALGIPAGAGVPPSTVEKVIGVVKAYATRVGEGPFPTELHDDTAERLRKAGHEFGTTTGRPRRCGWLDLVALRYTHMLNHFDTLALMKLDILDEMEEIHIGTGYRLNGRTIDHFPASRLDLEKVRPHYQALPGWGAPIAGINSYDALPKEAKTYIQFIEDQLQCRIGLISTGPDRSHTIILDQALYNQ